MNTLRFRWLTLLGLLVVLTASLSVAASGPSHDSPPAESEQPLLVPEPSEMGQCIVCTGYYQTATHWGTGSDCDEAESDLDSQLRSAAASTCDGIDANFYCNFQVVVTMECYYNSGGGYYVVDGYATHSCLEGDYFCPQ
jgi:hypothetical protein